VEFPNNGSPSLAVSNGDGTFNIYINTLFCEARQRESLKHEVEHLTEEHFFRDDLTITQIERSACGLDRAPHKKQPRIPDVLFYHSPGKIALFHSLESLNNYSHRYARQWKKEHAGKS